MTVAVAASKEYDMARVTINGVTHLRFRATKFLGLQTWVQRGLWCLEITLEGNVILAEYDDFAKLRAVVEALEGVL